MGKKHFRYQPTEPQPAHILPVHIPVSDALDGLTADAATTDTTEKIGPMRISVANARIWSNALLVAANEAEAKGETEFELLGSLQAQAQAALDDLQAAIDAKKTAS